MDIVPRLGWPGVMLHEAVGHGLEEIFVKKNFSIFEYDGKVASDNVTHIVLVQYKIEEGQLLLMTV